MCVVVAYAERARCHQLGNSAAAASSRITSEIRASENSYSVPIVLNGVRNSRSRDSLRT